MPRYSRSRYASYSRRSYKKSYKKRMLSGPAVKKALLRISEQKYAGVNISNKFNFGTAVEGTWGSAVQTTLGAQINAIAVGSLVSERVGNRITINSWKFRFMFSVLPKFPLPPVDPTGGLINGTPPSQFTLLMISQKADPNIAPMVTFPDGAIVPVLSNNGPWNLFKDMGNVTYPQNLFADKSKSFNTEYYTIHWKKTFRLGTNYSVSAVLAAPPASNFASNYYGSSKQNFNCEVDLAKYIDRTVLYQVGLGASVNREFTFLLLGSNLDGSPTFSASPFAGADANNAVHNAGISCMFNSQLKFKDL